MFDYYLNMGYSKVSSLNDSSKNRYLKTMIGACSIPITLGLIAYSVRKRKNQGREKMEETEVKNFTLLFALPPLDLESDDYTILKIVLSYDSIHLIRQMMSKYKGFKDKVSRKSKVHDFKYLPYIWDKDGLRVDDTSEILDKDKVLVNNYDARFMDIDRKLLNHLYSLENALDVPLNIFDIRKISTDPGIIGMRYIYPCIRSDIKHLMGMRNTFMEMHRDNPDKHDVDHMNSLIDFTIRYIYTDNAEMDDDTSPFVKQHYHGHRYLSLQEESDIPDKVIMDPQLGLDSSYSSLDSAFSAGSGGSPLT